MSEPVKNEVVRRFGNVELLHKISLVWLVMALACVPVWWRTTSVERRPIPYASIDATSKLVAQLPESRESMMTLSESYDILVTLVLPDINADWNIEEASDQLIDWTRSMRHIANFSVSSQIIYHPVALDRPSKLSKGGFTYSKSKLSNVINTLEAYLQSNLNPSSKLIQLVAYVPPAKFAPLSLESTGHRALLPDWGSFAILDGEVDDGVVIDANELIGSFVDDLDALFDVDNIAHARTIDNLRTTSNTLNSLSSLLQRVHNMVINEHVSTLITQSAALLKAALEQLDSGNHDAALKLSRAAVANSESAFFDPSLLELLYFPQDQKFAIYIPLFLPVSVPIAKGALQAIKYFKSRYFFTKAKTD